MESSSSSSSSSSSPSRPSSSSSPRYASYAPSRFRFEDEGIRDGDLEPRHFLDSCSLCGKPLSRNRDIYMYKGDTPFCSEECRQEQIDADEAAEKKWKHSAKGRKGQQQEEEIRVRARSTTVAG